MALVVRAWGPTSVVMTVCDICGIGAGVTRYPDGPFCHAEDALVGGLCVDCRRLARRHPRRAARYRGLAGWRGRRALTA
jgi:hypothetical protein